MTTPLDLAIEAFNERDQAGRNTMATYAQHLSETGVFSIRQIIAITDLPTTYTYALLEKADKRGGALNPEWLTVIQDFANKLELGFRDRDLARTIVANGTSPKVLEKLTGIPEPTVKRWIRQAAA